MKFRYFTNSKRHTKHYNFTTKSSNCKYKWHAKRWGIFHNERVNIMLNMQTYSQKIKLGVEMPHLVHTQPVYLTINEFT